MKHTYFSLRTCPQLIGFSIDAFPYKLGDNKLKQLVSMFRVLYADPVKVKSYLHKLEREGRERVKVKPVS